MKEADIALVVREGLIKAGWDVFPEASMLYGRGRADLACTMNDSLFVVETKLSLSMKLIDQANEWIRTKAVGQVAIAVPNRPVPRIVHEICQWKGIGIIMVHLPTRRIEIVREPVNLVIWPVKARKMMDSLHPDMKNYTPGTNKKWSTPYNRTMGKVREFVTERPGEKIGVVVDSVEHHYSSRSSALQSMPRAIRRFEGGTLRIQKRKGRLHVYPVKVHVSP